jgi:hypothetical protein
MIDLSIRVMTFAYSNQFGSCSKDCLYSRHPFHSLTDVWPCRQAIATPVPFGVDCTVQYCQYTVSATSTLRIMPQRTCLLLYSTQHSTVPLEDSILLVIVTTKRIWISDAYYMGYNRAAMTDSRKNSFEQKSFVFDCLTLATFPHHTFTV